jgi:hypothetical protein
MEDEDNENYDRDRVGDKDKDYVICSQSDSTSEDQFQPRMPGPVTKAKKKKNKAQGIFRATVNDTQQVLPSQPPQLKKHKAPELLPLVDANTSTKHTKTSKSGSLVPN